jgi:hypothetical protein
MTHRINVARWQPRVEEARRWGVSLKAYAAEQGMPLCSPYRPRRSCAKASQSRLGLPAVSG